MGRAVKVREAREEAEMRKQVCGQEGVVRWKSKSTGRGGSKVENENENENEKEKEIRTK